MHSAPAIVRVRHETKRRELSVARVERLAPKMVRAVLRGHELAGFTSLGFDDHVKLFFPPSPAAAHQSPDAPSAPPMRDFTPRKFDPDAGELWIDFFLHEAGPAASWAAEVEPGQTLALGGPRGSFIIPLDGIDSHVLIGDETALPAIARRLEELPSAARALVVIDAEEGARGYPLQSRSPLEIVWVSRSARPETGRDRLIETLRDLELPSGPCFTWVAAESQVARGVRRYLTDERGLDKRWLKAAGYWRRGETAVHDNISDQD